jgi:hypothetical protein
MRKRLVLPLPFGPRNSTSSPAPVEKFKSLKSRRVPRTHARFLTSSIQVSRLVTARYNGRAVTRWIEVLDNSRHTLKLS